MESSYSLPSAIQEEISRWLKAPIEEEIKEQIRFLLEDDPSSLEDCFRKKLSFGTSGFRSLMGVGPNRINSVTLRHATLGLASVLKRERSTKKSVVICYDHRRHSRSYAVQVARVLAANDISVFLCNELRPVPYLSFAVRHLQCKAGIMITASHNPKEYNGYKMYGEDGGEASPSFENKVMEAMDAIDLTSPIPLAPENSALIEHLSCTALDEAYLSMLDELQLQPLDDKQNGSLLKVIYSSLHGVGITLAPKALLRWGFSHLSLVEKQCTLDENFSTIKEPNPEHKKTMQLGIESLQANKADILLVNDGDANRVGVVAMHRNKPYLFNGNEMAALCAYFLCERKQAARSLPDNGAFILSLVTTELVQKIAISFGISCFEVDIGFKYIAEKIHEWEEKGHPYHFLFGAEESYGCLLTTKVRDKDGIAAACFLAEIALFLKKRHITLVDLLHQIYQKYGLFRELQHSLHFEHSSQGMIQRKNMMSFLRASPLRRIANQKILYWEDYQKGFRYYREKDTKEKLSLPSSNMLLYRLEDQSKVIIRPSGTEPKMRIYLAVQAPSFSTIEEGSLVLEKKIEELKADFVKTLYMA